MANYKKTTVKLFVATIMFQLPFGTHGQEIVSVDSLQVAQIEILDPERVARAFADLVSFYNIENRNFDVVFPQMSLEFGDGHSYAAIEVIGADFTADNPAINIIDLPESCAFQIRHLGPYQRLPEAIATSLHSLRGRNIPPLGEIRLLYQNSPDDHQPNELITDIQILIGQENCQ